MEDAFVGLPRTGESGATQDPVSQWRQRWEQDVAAAEQQGASGDARLALRRRDYGSYLFIGIDVVLAFAGSQLVASILALALFVATGHPLFVAGKPNLDLIAWSQTAPLILLGLLVIDGCMVLLLWYRLARQKLGWTALGLGTALLRRAPGRVGPAGAVAFGLVIGVLTLIVSDVLGIALQRLGFDLSGQHKLIIEPLQRAPLWLSLAVVAAGTFVAPVVEEIFFRGYIFRAVAVRRGLKAAYPISAGTFALLHLGGGSDILPLVPVLFVIGLMLCFAYRRTGNLLSDITAHAVNNGVTFALALLPLHI